MGAGHSWVTGKFYCNSGKPAENAEALVMGVYLHLVLSLKKYLYVALQRCTVIQYVYSPCLLVLLNRARAYQRQRSERK